MGDEFDRFFFCIVTAATNVNDFLDEAVDYGHPVHPRPCSFTLVAAVHVQESRCV